MKRSWQIIVACILTWIMTCGCGGGSSGGDGTPGATYTVGGTLTGLPASSSVVLRLNGGDDLTLTGNGPFTFSTALASGTSYTVTVSTNPTGRYSSVTNGTGTIVSSDVTAVRVNCQLDATFSTDGLALYATGIDSAADQAHDMVVDPDGKILVVGETTKTSSDYDMTVWRYNADGTLDSSFGGDGIVTYENANGDDAGYAIVLDADDRIVVAGFVTTASGDYDMAVWRYNDDGTVDNTFSGDGRITHNNAATGNGDDVGYGIALSGTDILVVGESERAADLFDMTVWKYDADGAIVGGFGSSGIYHNNGAAGVIGSGVGSDRGYALTIDGSNNILVAGESLNLSSNYDMAIWRLSSLGILDNTFGGGDGIVVSVNAAGGTGNDSGRDIVLDGSGNIFVTGYSQNASAYREMVLWKYNSSGTLDTGFSSDGIVRSSYAAGGIGDTRGLAMIRDASGRILVTGFSMNTELDYFMAIWRYTAAGALDTTFNGTGIMLNNSGTAGLCVDAGEAIALDASSRILVAGYSSQTSTSYWSMAVWRYYP